MVLIAYVLAIIAFNLKKRRGGTTRKRQLLTESEQPCAILAGRAAFDIFKILIEVAYILEAYPKGGREH